MFISGQDLAGKPGVDKSLQRDLDKISQQWDKLKRDVTDRHTRLQTAMVSFQISIILIAYNFINIFLYSIGFIISKS